MIAVKGDEDLSARALRPLVEAGHDVATVLGQGWIWPRVQAESRVFITADKGFCDIRRYPPGSHAGVIVLRPDRESVLAYAALLEKMIGRHSLDDLARCVTVVSPRGVRIRRPSND